LKGLPAVLIVALGLLGLLLPAGEIAGQEKELTPAEASEQALRLFKEGKGDEAVLVLRRAFFAAEGENQPGLAKNLGILHAELGRFPQAYYYASYFASLLAGDPKQVEGATETIKRIEKELTGRTRVQLRTDPPDALVYVDEKREENKYKAPVWWYFEPGEHKFIIEREGKATVERTFTVEPGSPLSFSEKLQDIRIVKPIDLPEGRSSKKAWAWVTLGTGIVLGTVGGVLQWRAGSLNDEILNDVQKEYDQYVYATKADAEAELSRRYEDEVKPRNQAAIALFAAGGVAVVGGAIWLIVDSRIPKTDRSVTVTPAVAPGTAGMMMNFTF